MKRTNVIQLMDRVIKWEVRSGREVLPGDLRKAKEADEKARKEML
jgi:hypothetical protein